MGVDTGAIVALVHAVRRELAAVADPAKALEMQRYMRSEMPFYGVQSPAQKAVFRSVFAAHPLADRATWEAAVQALWDGAEHREERYAAVALSGEKPYAAYQDPAALPLYRDLIVDGAWWDYVDLLAIHRVGPILRSFPEQVRPVVRRWSSHEDLWLRRTSIICQVGSRDALDVDLLVACIEPNLDDREFFIRKAIGWALRQHARVAPDWVRAFVAEHEDRLSALSRREALKHFD
jgi:3-methyladenine DNA glycosylase AlkD